MNDPVLTPKTMQTIALEGVGEQVRLQRRVDELAAIADEWRRRALDRGKRIGELEGFLKLLIEDDRLSPFTREAARVLLAKGS